MNAFPFKGLIATSLLGLAATTAAQKPSPSNQVESLLRRMESAETRQSARA